MKKIIQTSPNRNSRGAHQVSAIVLHSDAASDAKASLSWIASKASKVSYHALIDRNGDVYLLVPVALRAWHAGVSTFEGVPNVNDFSIGLAFANNNKGEKYTGPQIQSAVELCREWMAQFPKITKDRVTTHALVSPGRKTDPLGFDLPAFKALL